jgi:hypothetical protein
MTFSIEISGFSATVLSDVGLSQQSEHQRRDRLKMGRLISRLYSILVEPIRIDQVRMRSISAMKSGQAANRLRKPRGGLSRSATIPC